jgi:hypothetical protein
LVNEVDRLLQRLIAVKWKADPNRFRSHKALLIEYFRRSAIWAKKLDCVNEWFMFDIALHIDPTVRADNSSVQMLETHLNSGEQIPPEMKGLLHYALHWAAVKGRNLTEPFNIADPYEPIVMMYERGGFFYISHDGIEITYVNTISRRGWQAYASDIPYDNTTESELDSLDSGT